MSPFNGAHVPQAPPAGPAGSGNLAPPPAERLVALSAAGAALPLAAACAPLAGAIRPRPGRHPAPAGAPSGAAPAASPAGAAPAKPAEAAKEGDLKKGGSLKVAILGEPPALDMMFTTATVTRNTAWHDGTSAAALSRVPAGIQDRGCEEPADVDCVHLGLRDDAWRGARLAGRRGKG